MFSKEILSCYMMHNCYIPKSSGEGTQLNVTLPKKINLIKKHHIKKKKNFGLLQTLWMQSDAYSLYMTIIWNHQLHIPISISYLTSILLQMLSRCFPSHWSKSCSNYLLFNYLLFNFFWCLPSNALGKQNMSCKVELIWIVFLNHQVFPSFFSLSCTYCPHINKPIILTLH